MNDHEYEPTEGDYTITPCGRLGSMYGVGVIDGSFLGEFAEWDEAIAAISEEMENGIFWPNVWSVSDPGNWSLIDMAKERADREVSA